MARPEPPYEAPEGWSLVARPAPDWRPVTGRRCRRLLGGAPRRGCGAPSVAEMRRAGYPRPTWWAYCPEHLYGQWIEDGQVMRWQMVQDGAS